MILLVNPRSTQWRYRIPLSILSIGATLEEKYCYEIVDGNLEKDLISKISRTIEAKRIRYVGITVMPGPQLHEAIPLSKMIRAKYPNVKIVWGGYFPSLHTDVVLQSGYVDFVIRDQGDISFRDLIDALETGGSIVSIRGLSWKNDGIVNNQRQELIDPNTLPTLPYSKIQIPKYIGPTYLGTRTINYHSSVGCPFMCGFCAVAAVYKARWLGLTAERIASDLIWFRRTHGVNAVEFHDNNFFTSEQRVSEFSDYIRQEGLTWWGEARPDTLLAYDESTWKKMAVAGCKMVFLGAESGSDETLQTMHKGGTQTAETSLMLAEKMRNHNIIPEFSFVLGSPSEGPGESISSDIRYIRKIKEINPDSEIIIYTYSPVHFEDAKLFELSKSHGFAYPKTLDDWLLPAWRNHDLRKKPITPWLSTRNINRIRSFEKVLNAVHPTKSDLSLKAWQKRTLKMLGGWRYSTQAYEYPFEVALAQRLFRYRQPEIEGF